jgi:hypothetical protein
VKSVNQSICKNMPEKQSKQWSFMKHWREMMKSVWRICSSGVSFRLGRYFSIPLVLGLMLWMAACAISPKVENPDQPPNTGQIQQAIINGVKDLSHPAVGTLVADRRSFCSATLIAPRVVVTAAHCIDAFTQVGNATLAFRIDIPLDHHHFQSIFVGIDQANTKKHPQYTQSMTGISNDIAVVILQRAVFEVAPVPFNANKADATWIGRKALFMGYGRLSASSTSPAPRKYSTFLTINGVDSAGKINTIAYSDPTSSVCQGDSGGPAMLQFNDRWHVVGVTSHGSSYNCSGTSYSYRTDPYAPWIQGFIDQFAPCADANPSCGKCATCAEKTCVPAPVEQKASHCKVCNSDADCADGFCVQIGTGWRCVQPCDANSCCPPSTFCTTGAKPSPYCLPNEMLCPPVSCQQDRDCSQGEICKQGKCDLRLPNLQPSTCQPCEQHAQCSYKGSCQTPDGRGGRCLQACEGEAELCPEGFICRELLPGFSQCTPRDGVCKIGCQDDSGCLGGLTCQNGSCHRPNGSGVGEPCDSSLPCQADLSCIASESGFRCYKACGVSSGDAGAPCKENNVCNQGLQCMANPLGGNLCVEACNANSTCQTGGTCMSMLGICTCRDSSDCKAPGTCVPMIEGFVGICSTGQAIGCPEGEECASTIGQPSVCVIKGTGTRTAGQACDNINRCREGFTCVPALNVCLENCTQTGTCKYGGNCRQIIGSDRFCLCGQPTDCPSGTSCQMLGQGMGYCAPNADDGCSADGCPKGFTCENKKCVPLTKPDELPQQELAPEPNQGEIPAQSEIPAEQLADAGITETQSHPDQSAEPEQPTPQPQSCNCQSSSIPNELPIISLLLLLGLLLPRRRNSM